MVVALVNNHQQHHIMNMTKHAATCKSTADGCEQENMEGEATTSDNDARTVRQLTGETAGAQSIWNITGTVTEERRVEETPLSTQEQTLRQV